MAGGGLDSELKRTQRRKTIAATASALFLVLLVVGTVAFIAAQSDDEATVSAHAMHSTSKSVNMLCASTDYPNTCISTLTKALKSKYNDSSSEEDPKDLLYAALHVVSHEVAQAFNNSQLYKSRDSRVRVAVEDCKHLFDECKYNIERSTNRSIEFGNNWSHDLETWASAVISFEQTCIDSFPEGDTRETMKMLMKTAKEVSSNAVAIIGQVAGLLTLLGDQESKSGQRKLLQNAKGLPVWLSKPERRSILGNYESKPRPNVTVSKDGTGNYTTISAALAAIPEKYKGR
jgi:pectinesterase inhibitor-like protein